MFLINTALSFSVENENYGTYADLSLNLLNAYTKLINVYYRRLHAICRPVTKRRWFSVSK